LTCHDDSRFVRVTDVGGATVPTDQGWSDQKKWVAGIVASVITAAIGYALFGSGGLFNPKPAAPASMAQASISAFDTALSYSSQQNGSATFTVSNQGNLVANSCRVGGTNVSPFGNEFAIPAGGSVNVAWTLFTYGKRGALPVTAVVRCDNATSQTVSRTIEVL
jgi:hypothetical protein